MARKGKYAEVNAGLPTYRNENPKYREKLENRRKEIEAEMGPDLANDPTALTQAYIMARLEVEEKEAELKLLSLDLEAIEGLVTGRFKADELSSLTLTTGDNIRVQEEPYAVVEDKDKYWGWCVDNDLGPLMQLPWQTTNAMLKERLLKNEEAMEGVKAFVKPKVVFTRAKGEKVEAE